MNYFLIVLGHIETHRLFVAASRLSSVVVQGLLIAAASLNCGACPRGCMDSVVMVRGPSCPVACGM